MISPAACGRSMICIERELRTLLCKERDHAYTITGVNTQDSFDQTAIATRKCIFTYYLEVSFIDCSFCVGDLNARGILARERVDILEDLDICCFATLF